MKLNLIKNNFVIFKIISGFFLFISALFSPVSLLIVFAVLALGRAHSLGAWLGMWRGGKLNLRFSLYIIFIIIFIGFLGFKVLSFPWLILISSLLFGFHFIFDELDLQEGERNINSFLSSIPPAVILSSFLLNDFFNGPFTVFSFFALAVLLLFLEVLYVKEITWYFVQTKIILLFLLVSIFLAKTTFYVFAVLLMYHYIYWFIFPIYKLHKYKKDERDGFLIVLGLIVVSSIFIYSTKIWGGSDGGSEYVLRSFHIASLVHILTTAPFAYYFGLARPKIYESAKKV